MKLIVGLGNPGRKYQGTRHNVGFDVVEVLAQRYGRGAPKAKFEGEVVEAEIAGKSALLLCPHTFMNLSGQSVGQAFDFYKLELANVLVICDDFNLELNSLRFRAKGSSGGQKGLADISRRLGSELIARLRVGIGPVPGQMSHADFVLGRFSKKEAEEIAVTVAQAADGVHDWAVHGIDFAMAKYNS